MKYFCICMYRDVFFFIIHFIYFFLFWFLALMISMHYLKRRKFNSITIRFDTICLEKKQTKQIYMKL